MKILSDADFLTKCLTDVVNEAVAYCDLDVMAVAGAAGIEPFILDCRLRGVTPFEFQEIARIAQVVEIPVIELVGRAVALAEECDMTRFMPVGVVA